MINVYHTNIKHNKCFNTDNINKCILKHQNSKLEKIMKKGWKFSFAITGINNILKYIKIENSYFNCNQKCSSVSIRGKKNILNGGIQ